MKLARLSVPNFIAMLDKFSPAGQRLQMILDSYRLMLKTRFNWLNPGETVYFVARRHQFFPVFNDPAADPGWGMTSRAGLRLWYLSAPMLSSLLFLAVSIPAALAWLVWNYIDWSNDYYIITNQRVVYQERVVLAL